MEKYKCSNLNDTEMYSNHVAATAVSQPTFNKGTSEDCLIHTKRLSIVLRKNSPVISLI